MAADEELRSVYGMFTDTWKLYRKYTDIRQTQDTQWEMFIADADAVSKKYNSNKLCRDMILAVTSELERKSRENAT